MGKATIDSGPLEGFEAAAGGETFVRLEATVVRRPLDGDAGELYELVDGRYVYAENRWAPCACGALVRKVEGGRERQPCPLCGGRT